MRRPGPQRGTEPGTEAGTEAGSEPGAEPGTDRGAVTAELAIGMLGLTTVVAGLLSLGTVVQAQLRVHDAAAAGARLAARGETSDRVRQVAADLGGEGARVGVTTGGGTTGVRVTRSVVLLLPGSPVVPVEGSAVAVTESADAGTGTGAP